MVADNRRCDQCGEVFTPRREHARFCSADCRVIWNRQHAEDMPPRADTLEWSIAAMWQATEQLGDVPGCDPQDGFAIVGEAVWWVTMVDATLVRYRADAYGDLLAGLSASKRAVTEDTFGGLRFVRNRMAYDDLASFIQPAPLAADAAGTVGSWTWVAVPEPVAPALTVRARQWEMSRYHSYQAQLAGRPVGKTFARATAFLRRACEPSELHQR
ncbi:MAG: hypothetical protein ACR2FU_17305 [Streptosporangiaceae bacterium]